MQNISVDNSALRVPVQIRFASRPESGREEHQLRTRRLYLRPVNADDFDDYLALFSDPAVMQFVGIEAGYILKFEEFAQLFQGALEGWNKRGYGRWSLFDSESLEFVGFCGFRSENGVPELIAAIHERFWGRGLVAEAAAECLKYGYEALGFTRVKAFTRPNHLRARQVLKKLDAAFEGYIDFHGVEGASYNLLANNSPDNHLKTN